MIDYDSLPGLRWTDLARMRRSPRHYRYGRTERTTAIALGTALHALMSGEQQVIAYPGKVRRGKEWEAFQAQHRGALIMTRREVEIVELMGGALLKHQEASAILERCTKREHVIQWERRGRPCKCKIDGCDLPTDGYRGLMVELKSTRDVSARAFGQQIARLGYIHQGAWYRDGWSSTYGTEPEHVIVAVENVAPFDVRVDEMPEVHVRVADGEIERLLDTLERCEAAGEWPGLAPKRGSVADYIPDWWADDSQVEAVTLGGEEIET